MTVGYAEILDDGGCVSSQLINVLHSLVDLLAARDTFVDTLHCCTKMIYRGMSVAG